MKDCDYCRNAFTSDIDPEYDGSYLNIGQTEKGYRMFFGSAALSKPPVRILVDTFCEDAYYRGHKGCNVDIAIYTPKYCPECGRRIKENDKYRRGLKVN